MPEQDKQHFGGTEWAMTLMTSLVWGASFLFIAIALDHVNTGVIPMMRTFFGFLALLCIPRARVMIQKEDMKTVFFLSLIWMAAPFYLYPLAAHTVSSSVVGMINGALPALTVVVTAIMTRRRPTRQRITAVLVGFSGIALISFSSITDNASASVHGIFFLLLALLGYAVAVNIALPLNAKYGATATMMWVEGAAFIWTLPLGLPALRGSEFTGSAITALLILGAIGTGITFAVYSALQTRAGVVRAMIGTLFTPVVATILGVIFRDEHVTVLAIIGMFIVIIGAFLTSRPEKPAILAAL